MSYSYPEREAAWRAAHPDRMRGYRQKYERLHPPDQTKKKARRAVSYEIAAGRMERGCCEVCGRLAHAHHEDYSRPLDVRWFCQKHHNELHKTHHPS